MLTILQCQEQGGLSEVGCMAIKSKRWVHIKTGSSGGTLTFWLSRRPVGEQNGWKRTTETISRCKDFMSDEIHVTAASGQSGSPTVLSEGQMSFPQTHTHKHTWIRSLICTRSVEQAGSEVWRNVSPRVDGCRLAPGAWAGGEWELSGDFQLWAGENRQEGGNTGWAKPCGMTPRKEVNITGIRGHQRCFSTAGFNSWFHLLCWLLDCTAAEMGSNYLLTVPTQHALARR